MFHYRYGIHFIWGVGTPDIGGGGGHVAPCPRDATDQGALKKGNICGIDEVKGVVIVNGQF